MAFDITLYVDMSPKKVRELIRKGVIDFPGSLTVGYQKKVPAGRIKPAFFVSNFWFLSIVFYCNVL